MQVMGAPCSGRYFDVYTERASPDLGTGLSRSTSNLNIVAKQPKPKRNAKPDHDVKAKKSSRRRSVSASGILAPAGAVNARPDQAPVRAPLQVLVIEPPARSSSITSLSQGNTSSSASSRSNSPLPAPIARAPRSRSSSTRSSPTTSKASTSRLAILPVDLYAGPVRTVSAESMTDEVATSESQAESYLSYLQEDSEGDSPIQPSWNPSYAVGNGSSPRDRSGSSATNKTTSPRRKRSKDVLARSTSTPSSLRKRGKATSVSRSSTDTILFSPVLPHSVSTSTVSSSSSLSFSTPTDEIEFSWAQEEADTKIPESIQSIEDIIRNNSSTGPILTSFNMPASPPVPSIPAQFAPAVQPILSIDEIIKMNMGALAVPRALGRAASTPASIATSCNRSRTVTESTDTSQARSSMDSITGEIMQTLKAEATHVGKSLHHAKSQPAMSGAFGRGHRERQASYSSEISSEPSFSAQYSSPHLPSAFTGRAAPTTNDGIAQYLRSTRLTRLLTLRRAPNHHLQVSLADVGSSYGHPVVIFLGLGSVRYLAALYDELAEALGLRLICVDRWGLGKTGDVPDSRRGFQEWGSVVEEVLEQLEIDRFSILAHSAGAPYALATSIRLDSRVNGSIHLLAPWVSTAADSAAGAFKWLKYVPSSVIKTAQTAEWKMQSWKLGKPPTVPVQALGFNPRAPLSNESTASSPVFATFNHGSDEDDEPPTPRPFQSAPSFPSSPSISSMSEQDTRPAVPVSSPRLLPVPNSKPVGAAPRKGSKGLLGSLFGSPRPSSPSLSGTSERITRSSASFRSASPDVSSTRGSVSPSNLVTDSKVPKLDLGTALLRASHAESLKGGTADLMTILERTNKAAGFSYSDVERPIKVWHGLKDERISLQSVLNLESTMQNCKVTVIPGADHSLMTNVAVVVQVLNSIASDWSTYY